MARLRDWAVVALLTSLLFLSFLDRFAFSVLLDPLRKHMNLTDGQLGLLNGVAFGLFYAFMGLPLGWMADRWSRKKTIMGCVGLWTLACACCGLAQNSMQLLAARIGVGAGEAGVVPCAYSIMRDRFDNANLAKPISIFSIGGIVGGGASVLITGYLYDFFSGGGAAHIPFMGGLAAWQNTFIAVALPGLIFVPLVALLKEKPRSSPLISNGEKPESLAALARPNLVIYALLFTGMASVVSINLTFMSWGPTVFLREFGYTPSQVGSSYGYAALLMGPLGALSGGFAADRMARHGIKRAHVMVLLFAALGVLPAVLLFPLMSSPHSLLLVIGALIFFLSLPLGTCPAYIQIITQEAIRSRMSALYVLAGNVTGLGLAPVAVGFLSDLHGGPEGLRIAIFQMALGLVCVAITALTALFFWLGRPATVEAEHADTTRDAVSALS